MDDCTIEFPIQVVAEKGNIVGKCDEDNITNEVNDVTDEYSKHMKCNNLKLDPDT